MVKKLKPGKCGQTAGLIGTNFGALMQIHLERVAGPKTSGGIGVRGWGGGWGSEIQKFEKARVNTHMHIHLQRVVGQLGGGGGVSGGGGVGGQKFKSQKKHM